MERQRVGHGPTGPRPSLISGRRACFMRPPGLTCGQPAAGPQSSRRCAPRFEPRFSAAGITRENAPPAAIGRGACFMRPPGLEPGTLGLEGRCSIHLSYRRPPGRETCNRTRLVSPKTEGNDGGRGGSTRPTYSISMVSLAATQSVSFKPEWRSSTLLPRW